MQAKFSPVVAGLIAGLCFGLVSSSEAIIRKKGANASEDAALAAAYSELALQFPSVVMMQFATAGDKRSGVLIGDRWILTAGHNYPNATYAMPVTIAIPGPIPGTTQTKVYTTTNWYRHPGFPGVNFLEQGWDFSIARLSERVLNVIPSRLKEQNIFPTTAPNGYVGFGYVCGFGQQGDGLNGGSGVQGKKWAGMNALEYSYAQVPLGNPGYPFGYQTDFDDLTAANNCLSFLMSSAAPFTYECQAASGDSGAGLFIKEKNNEYLLVGITSFIGRYDGQEGTLAATKYGGFTGYAAVGASYQSKPVWQWVKETAKDLGLISGTVKLENYIGPAVGPPDNNGIATSPVFASPDITFELRNPGTTVIRQSTTLKLDLTNKFSFPTTLRGTFDLAIKGPTWLRKVIKNVNVVDAGVGNLSVTLLNGDADGDNAVSILDYSMLSASFDSNLGDSGYLVGADLDRDGSVSILDLSYLYDTYDLAGDD